ncbi:hypothetical protein Cgig2_009787 [Carnegiea gigantea]|uniref:Uncharacterized protein n=1 Tax=Carnegiea gigantea TaxID=171969 RepID=A0A9Q1JQ69_9CARY|nr:hypothetical protein Cgig2_009787 [Carnegiea gigantea]
MAKEAAEYYELSELPQAIFYAILLNEVEGLGSCKNERFGPWSQPSLSSAGAPSNRESGCMVTKFSKLNSVQRLDWRRVRELVDKKRAQREMVDHVRESFVWHWRRASRPPHPLPEDFHALCLRFLLSEAEGAAADFELPEMVQATFYAMLMNEAVELGVVHGFMAKGLNQPWWDPSGPSPRPLPSDYHGLCPRFDLEVVRRYAHNSNLSKMVPAIVYAMVIDDATELGLSCRLTMDVFIDATHIPEMVLVVYYAMVINDAARLRFIRSETGESLMSDLRKLRWDVIEAWLLSTKDKLKDAR